MSSDDTPQRQMIVRARAAADIEKCAEYLEEKATPETALRFRSAVADALNNIVFMPGAGSPRKVRNPALPGLRMCAVPNFRNYLLFYITPAGNVEVIRLLHGAQDVNNILEAEE